MFRMISDFEKEWQQESESTLKIFKALTDESLNQAVTSQDRTIGRIAWHLVQTIPEMLGRVGLKVEGPDMEASVPEKAADIVAAYETAAQSALAQIKSWNDETLLQEDDMYGERWQRGFTLTALIHHEAHHRGQLTVLVRQAGLAVPGVYGPAREEWGNYGMEAPKI